MSNSILTFDPTHPAAHRLAAPLVMQTLIKLIKPRQRVSREGSLLVMQFGSLCYPVRIPGYDATASSDANAIATATFLASAEFERLLDEGQRLADALCPLEIPRGDDGEPLF